MARFRVIRGFTWKGHDYEPGDVLMESDSNSRIATMVSWNQLRPITGDELADAERQASIEGTTVQETLKRGRGRPRSPSAAGAA